MKYRLIISQEALDKTHNIGKYIADKYKSPITADKKITLIKTEIINYHHNRIEALA